MVKVEVIREEVKPPPAVVVLRLDEYAAHLLVGLIGPTTKEDRVNLMRRSRARLAEKYSGSVSEDPIHAIYSAIYSTLRTTQGDID